MSGREVALDMADCLRGPLARKLLENLSETGIETIASALEAYSRPLVTDRKVKAALDVWFADQRWRDVFDEKYCAKYMRLALEAAMSAKEDCQ